MVWEIMGVVLLAGAAGGFVNVFIGDSGLHLPTIENGIFRPGFLGVIFVGMMAAFASWASLKSIPILGAGAGTGAPSPMSLSTSDLANGLLIGFGGARWFKSEIETQIFRKTASIAASKQADAQAANIIAGATPMQALDTAMQMP